MVTRLTSSRHPFGRAGIVLVLGLVSPANGDGPPSAVGSRAPGALALFPRLSVPHVKRHPPTVPVEKYRELQERLDRLQAQLDAGQPVRPRSCELEGRLEQRGRQTVVRLKATFKVTTIRPDVVVLLGCQRTHPVEARGDDGKVPLLSAADDGLRVQFPTAGDHMAHLDLDLPVGPKGPKGAELGFELGLPGAAITALAFEPPADVRRYTLTTRVLQNGGAADPEFEQAEVERFLPGKGGAPLGPITSFALSWEDPSRKADAIRTADGDVSVTVDQDEVTTEARLRLRGSAAEWRFTAPAMSDVTVGPWPGPAGKAGPDQPPGRARNVVRPEPGQNVWRVETREPASGDLLAVISTRVPRGRDAAGRGPFPIGPFAVLGVAQQSGVIRVRTPLTWKAVASRRGDTRKEFDDGSGEVVYRYRYPPLQAAPTDSPVTLTLTPAAGVVHGRVRHFLRLGEAGWRLRSELAITPSQTELDAVEVEVPDGFRLADVEPRELVDEAVPGPPGAADSRLYRIRLTAARRTSFAVTLLGEYATGRGATASLRLPRPRGVLARNSDVVVEAPAAVEVRGSVRAWDGERLGTWDTPLQVDPADVGDRSRAAVEGFAGRVDVHWRPAAADARVAVTADVDLEPSRMLVREHLTCRFPGRIPERVRLTAGVPVTEVRAGRGTVERTAGGWDLLPGEGDRQADFTLVYSAPPPAAGAPTRIPLLLPEVGATGLHVRVWAGPEVALRLADPTGWRVAPPEIVGDRAEFPDLVLRADGAAGEPMVEVVPRLAGADGGPIVDAMHVECRLGPTVAYRVQLRMTGLATATEVGLPAGAWAAEAFVLGRRLPGSAVRSEAAPIIQVPAVLAPAGPTVVEVRYRLPPGGHLEPPRLIGGELAGDVMWTVIPSAGRLALRAGDAGGGWNGWTPLTILGVSRPTGPRDAGPPLFVRRTDSGPLDVVEVDRLPWLFGWSLAAAVCGIGLGLLGPRARRLLALTVGVAVAAAALVCPQPLSLALAAAAPGAAGALVIWFGYRAVQLWYRRRLARSPGFARPGSSLIRPSAARGGDSSARGSLAVPTAPASAP